MLGEDWIRRRTALVPSRFKTHSEMDLDQAATSLERSSFKPERKLHRIYTGHHKFVLVTPLLRAYPMKFLLSSSPGTVTIAVRLTSGDGLPLLPPVKNFRTNTVTFDLSTPEAPFSFCQSLFCLLAQSQIVFREAAGYILKIEWSI